TATAGPRTGVVSLPTAWNEEPSAVARISGTAEVASKPPRTTISLPTCVAAAPVRGCGSSPACAVPPVAGSKSWTRLSGALPGPAAPPVGEGGAGPVVAVPLAGTVGVGEPGELAGRPDFPEHAASPSVSRAATATRRRGAGREARIDTPGA